MFKVTGESITPKREDVLAKVIAQLNLNRESVALTKLATKTGHREVYGEIHEYASKKELFESEPKYILARNKLVVIEKKQKAEAKKEEKKE